MKVYNWEGVEKEQLNPLLARQMIHGQRMTVARIHLARSAVVPMHRHGNEQITLLLRGTLRFLIEGREKLLRAGEVLVIPPDAPHQVEALEDSLAVDLFSPVREDWIRGDDAYLKNNPTKTD